MKLIRKTHIQHRIVCVGLLLSALLFSACGGGSGDPPAETNSNWDNLVWDRDNWS